MRLWPRRTIRNRLTLWHGGFFFLGGLLLLLLTTSLLVWSVWIDREAMIDVGRAAGISEERLTGDDPLAEIREETTVNGVPYEDLLAEVDIQDPNQGIEDLFNFSLVSLAALTVIAALFGFWSSGRMLRPVAAVTAAAKRISESNLSERLALSGPQDELRDLADTFDGMLDRLEAAFRAQGDFISNASHELRTPLAIMQTELDVNMSDPSLTEEERAASLTALHEAVTRSELVIDRLLLLAASEVLHDRVATDLARLVEHAIDHPSGAAEPRRVGFAVGLEPAPVSGDPALLAQMVGNLVQNAIAHNREDGWVRVTTGTGDGESWLVISNSGVPISAEEGARLFDRFYRTASARGGSVQGVGLGLPIVRSIARAHGGDVTAIPRNEGGLEVRLALPSLPAEAEAR